MMSEAQMRQFKVEESSGSLHPVFDGDDPEAWVLAAFLREATSFLKDMAQTIASAQTSDALPVTFGGNEVFLDAYRDKVVITAQWIKDTEGEEYFTEVSSDGAARLLDQWRLILAERARK